MAKLDFLGTGFSFPFRFSPTGGGLQKNLGVSSASDIELINDSLEYILSTQIGERPMRRDFGCQLRELVFEPNDPLLDAKIDFYINVCIQKWEKRIYLTDIRIDRSERKRGLLTLDVTYRIISSNVEGNLVYPFYLEGFTQETNAGFNFN